MFKPGLRPLHGSREEGGGVGRLADGRSWWAVGKNRDSPVGLMINND